MGIKFNREPLAVEQNNYTTKIVNAYIVYELDTWPRNPTNNFKFENFLSDATSIVKNRDKEKWEYSDYGIKFDGEGSGNFGNDFARNIVIFGADNSSSTYVDSRKNNFSMLSKGSSYGINGSFDAQVKTFSINSSKARTKFWIEFAFLLMENKYLSLKPIIKNVKFPTQFCLGSTCNGFGATESREISLKGNVYDFSVYYHSIDKSIILNKFLMIKNNI